jgi:mono/diheme cytochrome c family protein
MKKVVALCVLAVLGGSDAYAAGDDQAYAQIERGKYLATAGDCTACHTRDASKPFAGGKAIVTPFGTLLSSNITPDRDTGIGAWSDEDFVSALQKGVRHDGTHLFPGMPYPYYTKVARADILAIRAWLNTLSPVRNSVVSDQLPFPFDVRTAMIGWNKLFFKEGELKPVAGKSAEWNRGAYLVEGLGHCAACHTPKNPLGGDETGEALQGGVIQNWFAPDLDADTRAGLGSWSADDIVRYLKTGHNRLADTTGPMAEVVMDSTSLLTDADLEAMATYLKDRPVPDTTTPQPVSADDRMMAAGQALYVDNCSACHAPTAEGIPGLFPSLKGSASVQSAKPTSLIRVVLEGAQSAATKSSPTALAMPSFAWKLSDEEVAAVVTYIRNTWGNAAPAVAAGDVKNLRQTLSQSAHGN